VPLSGSFAFPCTFLIFNILYVVINIYTIKPKWSDQQNQTMVYI
jgi:hypothetical protein